MNDEVLLIGSGGHASVLIEMLTVQNINVFAYVSPFPAANQKLFSGIKRYDSDQAVIERFNCKDIKLVNGIGSMPNTSLRASIYDHYVNLGFKFSTVVSQRFIVSNSAQLADGVQVMHGAIIQAGASVGYNTIVNTGAIIEHDCSIGNDNHLAPGTTLSGNVTSSRNVHFGTGASVIQLVDIGENVIIGAGVSITKNIEKNSTCYPARNFIKVNTQDES
jgi:sugar O-acyltransferase (sialic acid O-acetyltransferase NeuD family)